uniref:Uncharacterized protein n=1 Tax=Microbotryum cf. violaceum BFL-2013 TaxID=1288119 RepID=M1GPF4_9BASI|nr:hypothetical protein H888_mgp39 [Microbotryum cf. violaceum BFL-2013]AGE14620.1 hypothetical protein [Microbotryum cf. violaceum BFL-2013]
MLRPDFSSFLFFVSLFFFLAVELFVLSFCLFVAPWFFQKRQNGTTSLFLILRILNMFAKSLINHNTMSVFASLSYMVVSWLSRSLWAIKIIGFISVVNILSLLWLGQFWLLGYLSISLCISIFLVLAARLYTCVPKKKVEILNSKTYNPSGPMFREFTL